MAKALLDEVPLGMMVASRDELKVPAWIDGGAAS
jgi:hypothetical protein